MLRSDSGRLTKGLYAARMLLMKANMSRVSFKVLTSIAIEGKCGDAVITIRGGQLVKGPGFGKAIDLVPL